MKKYIIHSLLLALLLPVSIVHAGKEPVAPVAPVAPKKAFFGVVTDSVRSSTAVQLGITPGLGLNVTSVVSGSSADEYGIEKYDILLEMDGQMLTNSSQFSTLLSMHSPGDEVDFGILRRGEKIVKTVVLGGREQKKDISFKFETKMEALGEKLEALAEKHELQKFIGVEASMIEEKVRAALENAKYHIEGLEDQDDESEGSNHTTRTSIINSGISRTIESSEDGTLILEPGEEENTTKLIAINAEGDVVFKGLVSEDGDASELDGVDEWIKRRFQKMNREQIRIIVTDDIEIEEIEDVDEVE